MTTKSSQHEAVKAHIRAILTRLQPAPPKAKRQPVEPVEPVKEPIQTPKVARSGPALVKEAQRAREHEPQPRPNV